MTLALSNTSWLGIDVEVFLPKVGFWMWSGVEWSGVVVVVVLGKKIRLVREGNWGAGGLGDWVGGGNGKRKLFVSMGSVMGVWW